MTGFVAAALVAVQMSVDCDRSGCQVARDVVEADVPGGYEAASVVAIVGGVSTIVLNTSPVPRRAASWFGVATGALGVGLFLGTMNKGEEYVPLRSLNLMVGVTSLVLGFYGLERQRAGAEAARVTAAPWRGSRGGTGMLVRVSF